MKILFPLSIVGLLLLATPGFSAAPAFQVEVKCEPKRADVKRSASTSTEEAAESWVYLVTVTSHTFQDIPDVRVEYIVFATHERFGSKSEAKPERVPGSKTLGTLARNGKTSFETEPVTLKKARLKADWYYTNGAKSKAKDELRGVLVRVYSGDQLIGEFSQPASLKTQEKWEG